MKIGFFTDYYFPSVGGTEVSIYNYKTELEKLGHTVYLFCPDYGRGNPKNEDASIVRLSSIPWLRINGCPILMLFPGITGRIASYELDIVHSMTPFLSTLLADKVARRSRIPHVATLYTLISEQIDAMTFPRLRSLLLFKYGLMTSLILGKLDFVRLFFSEKVRSYTLVWRYLLSMLYLADKTVVPSPHVAKLLKNHSYEKDTIVIPLFSSVPLGHDLHDQYVDSLLQENTNTVKIVAAGRLSPEKRIDVLLSAVAKLPKDVNWRLIIAGDGNERSRLESLSHKLGIGENVVLCGSLAQTQLAQLLYASDVFTLTSYRFDTQGIVILDAARNGLPIVYCDDQLEVGLDSTNSILSSPDATAICQALQKLVLDDELRQNMGEASLEVATRYRPDKLAKSLASVYQDLRSS